MERETRGCRSTPPFDPPLTPTRPWGPREAMGEKTGDALRGEALRGKRACARRGRTCELVYGTRATWMCTADARSTIDAHGMQSHVRAGRVAATTFSGC